MSFLGRQLVKNVLDQNGVLQPPEPAIQFMGGSALSVIDAPATSATLVTVPNRVIPLLAATIASPGSTSSTTFVDLVRIANSPFSADTTKKFYASVRASTSGTAKFDLFDNVNSVSLLAAVIQLPNTSATFAVFSVALVLPMLGGGDYSIRALNTGGGGGGTALISAAWIA